MLSLKHLVRSLNGICVLSARKDMCTPRMWNYLVSQCDVVLEFKPFNSMKRCGMAVDFANKVGNYRGILQLAKLNWPGLLGEFPVPTRMLGYELTPKEVCCIVMLTPLR